ncbi:hypothetical protein Trco_007984 [Trichoderma cornu-damae]|uniref:Uncharacterized protein n=1 Tax=Trichoderma cornu-damae TaxID=654480 RepID=A0A9P8QF13_9HYPO|nr:hypothetical protein Trco_007984 [Trichoderma cornu-damae]
MGDGLDLAQLGPGLLQRMRAWPNACPRAGCLAPPHNEASCSRTKLKFGSTTSLRLRALAQLTNSPDLQLTRDLEAVAFHDFSLSESRDRHGNP